MQCMPSVKQTNKACNRTNRHHGRTVTDLIHSFLSRCETPVTQITFSPIIASPVNAHSYCWRGIRLIIQINSPKKKLTNCRISQTKYYKGTLSDQFKITHTAKHTKNPKEPLALNLLLKQAPLHRHWIPSELREEMQGDQRREDRGSSEISSCF